MTRKTVTMAAGTTVSTLSFLGGAHSEHIKNAGLIQQHQPGRWRGQR